MNQPPALPSRATFLAGSASATLLATGSAALAASPIPLRVGFAPTDSTAEVCYGHDRGTYRAAGLDVQIETVRNTGDATAALTAGSLDIITGSIVPLAQAFSHGFNVRAIAPLQVLDGPPPQAPMVVVSGSKLATGAAFNGKTVAVNGLGDLTHLSAMAWLDANGAEASTVKFIEIHFPEMVAALTAGRVDGAILVEPFLTAARGQVTILGEAMSAVARRFMVTGCFATLSWLQQNHDAAKAFAAATLRTGAWANTHRDESGVILARYTPMQPETIRAMGRSEYAEKPVTPDLIQPVLDAMTKYFQTKSIAAPDMIWSG